MLTLMIPLGAVGALAAGRGLALVVKGYSPETDFSPHTVRYITDHVPPGAMLAANQRQLWALSLDYAFLMIPWDQPVDNWPRDYGIAPWTRVEALKAFVENDVRYVVLFLGQTGEDRVLTRYSPGKYVGSSLLREPLPEVAAVTRLPDGVVVTPAGALGGAVDGRKNSSMSRLAGHRASLIARRQLVMLERACILACSMASSAWSRPACRTITWRRANRRPLLDP
jgi:hypothetical protein